jgi:MFS family permease
MWSAYAAGGVAIVGMALAPDAVVVGIFSAIEVGLLIYGDVLWVAMMQELVPSDVLGRVFSLVYLLAFSLGPLGILLGGVVANAIGTREALAVSGAVSGLICVAVLLTPGVRDPERETGIL